MTTTPDPASRPAIRAMTAADLTAVLTLEEEAHARPWSARHFLQELANPHATIDLAVWPEGLAGFLCSWWVAGELEILNVVTGIAWRRRGIARSLLAHRLAAARRRGLERAFLEVRTGNAGAIALYRAFGFRPLDVRRGYYADGEDALVMVLEDPEPSRQP